MITIENLIKNYGSKSVLRSINLQFERGKVYGIVGENGAGKSTLFRCIAGMEDYEGNISADLEPLKNHLGFLETSPYLLSKITGEEHILLLCNARQKQVKNISEWNIFDLPLSEYATTYSTGMKKKLALTAIFLQGNEYFILDEPYNGIDLQSSLLLTEIIHKLRVANKIVIISSHIFSTLKDTCDEIHHLEDGQISASYQQAGFSVLEEKMKELALSVKLNTLLNLP